MLLTQKVDSVSAPSGDLDLKDLYRSQWKQVQGLADSFWRRWRHEYLVTLQPRRKWQADQPSLQAGDIVLLKDSQAKRNEGPAGLVVNTFPGQDKSPRDSAAQLTRDAISPAWVFVNNPANTISFSVVQPMQAPGSLLLIQSALDLGSPLVAWPTPAPGPLLVRPSCMGSSTAAECTQTSAAVSVELVDGRNSRGEVARGHISVKTVSCCRDLELLAVSLRPYYLPREFSHVITVCVYIPPRADAATSCEKIHSVTARLQTQHPEAFMIISGDFNHATLDSTLAVFNQVVDCPTRNNRTIDLLYVNVRDAYRSTPLPPLGKSDHNLVHLQPLYTPLVQKQPVTTRSVRRWSPEKESALRDCFNTTVWDVLLNPHGEDIEGMTHCLTDYLNFCADVVSPVKTVRCYPNNKPWVTREVKTVLNKKKGCLQEQRQGGHESSTAGGETLCEGSQGQLQEERVEQKLRENNMREVWEGVKTITGLNTKTRAVGGTMERANKRTE
ncbi:hypothetical protein L3Q82_017216 [Scortum barcoo]|uniref:Uncharacterized protein n=1 Tax=Scortum barcoo TaxID=214431 RepID=A0ACB8VPI7_9TELE|nr:hypothetical protein L3Q82_017216 [Scortum barcoo]